MPITRRGPLLLVYALYQQTARLLESHIDMSALAGEAFAVYSVIGLEEPVTPTRLAEILEIRPTSLSYVIRQMQDRGDLERVPNPADGRSVLLRLTRRGRRELDRAVVGFRAAFEAFEAELEVDQSELLDHLEAMSSALARALEEGAAEDASA